MSDLQSERCKYTWPEDFDGQKYNPTIGQNCCFRRTLPDTNRCPWHADPRNTTHKNIETLSRSRSPDDIRRLNSNCSERLDGAIVRGMDLAIGQLDNALEVYGPNIDAFSFADCSLRDSDFKSTNLGARNFEDADLFRAEFEGAKFEHSDFTSARMTKANFQESEFWYTKFDVSTGSESDFSDASMNECTFSKGDFSESDFEGVAFKKADFSEANVSGADFTDASLREADFSHANAELAIFNRANLFDVEFELSRLYGAIFGDSQVNEGTFENVSLSEVEPDGSWRKKLHTYIWGPVGNDSYRCVYDPNIIIDRPTDFDQTDSISTEARAGAVYRQFEQLATANALPNWQRRFYILRQSVYRHRLKKEGDRLGYWFQSLQRMLFGYGEHFSRIVGWSGAIILLFSIIYLMGGWIHPVESQGTLGQPIFWKNALSNPRVIWDSIYYSTLTFTALGFGDFRPMGTLGQLFTIAETSAGAILLALLVFVFGRRTAR
ncbi:pentapeptide repeat-containing protein [Halorussus litoreus]|uniref:pentapeptide repeat-containing protein n=1 Tax=Halorussus litoreus TaxID=1710536 RepID=UPI0013006117|nr:pentapeptide repeat-containing protein [Halorussus litoreus]